MKYSLLVIITIHLLSCNVQQSRNVNGTYIKKSRYKGFNTVLILNEDSTCRYILNSPCMQITDRGRWEQCADTVVLFFTTDTLKYLIGNNKLIKTNDGWFPEKYKKKE